MPRIYASVECLYRPDLCGQPVAVSGDVEARHGIILAKTAVGLVVKPIQSISRGIADGGAGEKPDFLALPEVAALLQVSHQTIYNMVRDGRLRAQKVGREWRFRREDLLNITEPQVALAARAEKLTERDKAAVAKRLTRGRNKVHVS